MKNKLLVSVFAVGIALAFTSCETKSNVMGVCTDMLKETMHNTPRSLLELDGQTLKITELEFPGGVNDNKLVYRTIAFGNRTESPKQVENMTYEYGAWKEDATAFNLRVTPASGEPFEMVFSGNAFHMPDGRVIGGEGLDNSARVEKWEKVIATLPNTEWEGTFRDELVFDSVFRDSIRTTYIPPMTFITDTIQVFDHLDTIGADTTCYLRIKLERDATSKLNTGHLYRKEIRSKYDRKTKTTTIVSEKEREYDCEWFFSEVSSDSKFMITTESKTAGVVGEKLNISKYKLDEAGKAHEFSLGGVTYTRYVAVP